jgi:hypothetical protein
VRTSLHRVAIALEAALIFSLLLSSAIFAQGDMTVKPTDLSPFSGNVTSVTILAASLYVAAKLGEFALKIVDLLKTRTEKEENSKILGDLIKKTAECERKEENTIRLTKELDECEAECKQCRDKADEWRNRYYEAREELAMLKGIEPPSSSGSSRLGWGKPPPEAAPDAKP